MGTASLLAAIATLLAYFISSSFFAWLPCLVVVVCGIELWFIAAHWMNLELGTEEVECAGPLCDCAL
jgi:hypothetical protein